MEAPVSRAHQIGLFSQEGFNERVDSAYRRRSVGPNLSLHFRQKLPYLWMGSQRLQKAIVEHGPHPTNALLFSTPVKVTSLT
jgi:hypothetical protein